MSNSTNPNPSVASQQAMASTEDRQNPPDAGIDQTSASSKKKKPKKKPGDPPQKRGNKGNFHGKRLEFLNNLVPACFWDTTMPAYHDAFPWRLPRDQDPPDDAEELAQYARAPENAEEEKKMAEVIEHVEEKIINWFSRKRSQLNPNNPFQPMLKQLRAPQGPAPRRIPIHQFYMAQAEFAPNIAAEFKRLGYEDKPMVDHINLRNVIAKEMLKNEPEEVQMRMKREVEEEYVEALERHQAGLEGLPSPDEADQAEARQRMASVAQQFLDLLQAYTGYHLTLLAGRVSSTGRLRDVDVTSLHAGVSTTSPGHLDFSRATAVDHKETLKLFSKFVAESYLAEKHPVSDATSAVGVRTTEGAASSDTVEGAAGTAEGGSGDCPDEVDFPAALSASTAAPPPTSTSTPSVSATPVPDASPVPSTIPAPSAAPDIFRSFKSPPGEWLCAELLALSESERDARIARLDWLSPYELMREDNIARNKATMRALGLMGAIGAPTTWSGASAAAGQKRKGKSGQLGSRKRPRGEEVEDADEDEDASDGEPAEPRVTRSKTRAAKKAPATKKAPALAPESGNKEWAELALSRLDDNELGAEWKALCKMWYTLEESTGFLCTTEGGELLSGGSEGDWGGMHIPGVNGLLNVLMCLKWWAKAANGEPGERWKRGVADVTWVLQRLAATRAKDPRGEEPTESEKEAAPEEEESPATQGADKRTNGPHGELTPEEEEELLADPEADQDEEMADTM
ncbi:hypothetical protein GGX14DRAFT_559743 [Mycena pura]|uniref:Uncharacterized protein n=1 Tax=Mycena pura TaxID=153505 RepID=A0AAD6VRA3_9AGAR|nr:hypothetical protein GGX14DRAFT_559743 [Mycena pura]